MRRALLAAVLLLSSARARADEPPPRDVPVWAVPIVLGAVYGGLAAYAFAVWYDRSGRPFTVGGDGFFGADTYAGGADKIGHMWMNTVLTRAPTQLMVAAGWRRLPSSLLAGGLSLTVYTLFEIKDGYYWELSPGDLAFDALGAGLGVLLENVPAVDRLIDLRMSYLPSREWRDKLDQDYAGETFLMALKLGGIPPLRDSRYLGWTRWLDVVVGYHVNFMSMPLPDEVERQRLFVGLSLDLQQVVDDALRGKLRGAGHLLFEHLAVPYTFLPVVGAERAR